MWQICLEKHRQVVSIQQISQGKGVLLGLGPECYRLLLGPAQQLQQKSREKRLRGRWNCKWERVRSPSTRVPFGVVDSPRTWRFETFLKRWLVLTPDKRNYGILTLRGSPSSIPQSCSWSHPSLGSKLFSWTVCWKLDSYLLTPDLQPRTNCLPCPDFEKSPHSWPQNRPFINGLSTSLSSPM